MSPSTVLPPRRVLTCHPCSPRQATANAIGSGQTTAAARAIATAFTSDWAWASSYAQALVAACAGKPWSMCPTVAQASALAAASGSSAAFATAAALTGC